MKSHFDITYQELTDAISKDTFKIRSLCIIDEHSNFFYEFVYYTDASSLINVDKAPKPLQAGLKYILKNYVLTVKVNQNNSDFKISFIDDFKNFDDTYYYDELEYLKYKCFYKVDYYSNEIWSIIKDKLNNF